VVNPGLLPMIDKKMKCATQRVPNSIPKLGTKSLNF
jgi:hypothetical protein